MKPIRLFSPPCFQRSCSHGAKMSVQGRHWSLNQKKPGRQRRTSHVFIYAMKCRQVQHISASSARAKRSEICISDMFYLHPKWLNQIPRLSPRTHMFRSQTKTLFQSVYPIIKCDAPVTVQRHRDDLRAERDVKTSILE